MAKKARGPVPIIIGIGPTSIIMPVLILLSEAKEEAMTKMIPIKIRKNPTRNNFNPVDLNAVMFPSFFYK